MRFLVHSRMMRAPDAEITALFPAEQASVAELFKAGVLEQLYVSSDTMQAWQIYNVASEEAARTFANSLPLARFAERQIIPLLDLQ